MDSAAPPHDEPLHATRARILLGEDDDEMRGMVAAVLRADGHDVVEARDGGRMLVRLARAVIHDAEPFDLLVSDVRMPVCSGLQLLENLRMAHCRTPAILMTAFGDERTRARAANLGAVMLMKPFDIDDLRSAVLSLIAGASTDSAGSDGA